MNENVFTYLDGYCERAGLAGGFAEPLNLLTNLFFILAAVLAGRVLREKHRGQRVPDLWLLVGFLFAIGIGSGLWHWHPTGKTVLMDVIPITLFINLYIISALRRFFQLGWSKVVSWWGLYMVVGVAAQATLPPDMLNGTIMYIPTYGALLVMTLALRVKSPEDGQIFAQGLAVWTLSLLARTFDISLCHSLPLGTHFLWHTLNAWVLWRLLVLLIDRARKAE